MKKAIPFALFNSKALFNPYQYKPFFEIKKNDATEFEWNGKNLFITDEVGVGKTFEAGIILQELLSKNPNLSVLIICPVKLCSNWENELGDSFYLNFNNYWRTKQLGQLNIVPYSYFISPTTKISEAEYEELNATENNLDREEILPNLKNAKLHYDILILDEAHYIRNEGKLWHNINQVINDNEQQSSKLKIFMTATPIFNSENDYDNITALLQKNQQEYATTTTLQGEANCYDFLLDIQVRNIKLNVEEQKVIEEIENGYFGQKKGFMKRVASSSIFTLKEFVDKKVSIENKTYDAGVIIDSLDNWSEENDTKLEELHILLEELQANDNNQAFKVVIFSTFLSTCAYLERKLKAKYKVYTITGQDNQKKLHSTKMNFKNEQHSTILICSDAAKEGHNMQFCHYLIHYDFPYTPAALGQRNGRIYRKGMTQTPKIFYMHVENSYDDRLFGEIIVSKSRIIKDLSEQGKVSILNVLPKDSKDYIEKCLEVYFKTKVTERVGDRDYIVKIEQEEFKFQLKKQFSTSINGLREWDSEFIKNLYEEPLNEQSGYYLTLFKNIFNVQNYIPGDIIISHYKEKYDLVFKEISQKIFGCETQEEFIHHCSRFVGDIQNEFKFCHDMLRDSEIELSEYIGDFEPLIRVQGAFLLETFSGT